MQKHAFMVAVLALAETASSPVFAVSFPTAGGSYTADVAFRVDWWGNRIGTAAGSLTNCSVQGGSAASIVNQGFGSWQLQSMANVGSTAVATLGLDQSYSLNRIDLRYGDYRPAEQQLRVSPDGSSWTTVLARSAVGTQTQQVSFSATPVRYAEWMVWGLGQSGGYAYLQEMLAYVDSGAAAPQKEEGYNLGTTMSVISKSNWISWAQPETTVDGNYYTYAIPDTGLTAQAVYDLGGSYPLKSLRLDFAYGQSWASGGSVAISPDNVTWNTLLSQTTNLGNTMLSFGPTNARYIRITGTGGGALGEVEVFALLPEPASLALLGLGAMVLLRRQRKP